MGNQEMYPAETQTQADLAWQAAKEAEQSEQSLQIEQEWRAEQEKQAETVYKAESLPEAGGVAWVDLYGVKSFDDAEKPYRKIVKISLTSRASSPKQALVNLIEAIEFANQFNLKPYSP